MRIMLLALLLAFLAVGVSACGSGDDQSAEPTESPGPATADEAREGGGEGEGERASNPAQLEQAQKLFERTGLTTDPSNSSIDLSQLIGGGPPKDGIPALTNPGYVTGDEAPEAGDVRGLLVDFEGEQRFYPFNIMVWHEVVNDSIGDVHYAVTFCPLGGSGIVFDRDLGGEVVEFGASGLLWKSNLVMYDRGTESLWSQTSGEAIVGPFTGTRLELLPVQLLTMEQVREGYPDALVLSRQTGHNRGYERNPYGDYDTSERLLFPVGDQDDRFFAKERFWVFWAGETSVAFPMERLGDKPRTTTIAGHEIEARSDGGSIDVTVDGRAVPGYVEMWFSWISTHTDDGFVWNLE